MPSHTNPFGRSVARRSEKGKVCSLLKKQYNKQARKDKSFQKGGAYGFVKYCHPTRGRESGKEPGRSTGGSRAAPKSLPYVTIINSIADLGKKNRNTLELTTQPAIESVETALPVDGKKAINP